MVSDAHRTLHGPDLRPQGADRDERPDRSVRLRTSNQISLETSDAQDGEAGRYFMFCARCSVSHGIPYPLTARTPANMNSCVVIGIVRFWLIFTVDLLNNLTGTSLTTFMLCSIELMLAGLCINIPMLRPFYLRWRTKQKSCENGLSDGQAAYKSYQSDPLAVGQPGQRNHTAWIELVSQLYLYRFRYAGLRLMRQDDKDEDTCNYDDGSSERKLTTDQPSVIHVSKDWTVASSKHVPS